MRASQFRRLLKIHGYVAQGRRLTAASLSREFEVSERTCKRDIETLRDYFGAPLSWDASRHCYVYTEPFDLKAHVQLTAEEALALVLASKTFAAWGDTQLARALESAMGKVTERLADHASFPLSDIESLISEPVGKDPGNGLAHFADLLEAIPARHVVSLVYRKPGKAAAELRRVHPLHLALQEGRWILVAHDPRRRGIRQFVLYRIEEVEAMEETFEPPAGFDAKAYLRGSFGHFAGEEEREVAIRILPELAPYIRERPWHPTQRVETQPDGGLIVRYRLTSLEDIRRWILSWGSRAEALEPPELRQAVRLELEEARGRYGNHQCGGSVKDGLSEAEEGNGHEMARKGLG